MVAWANYFLDTGYLLWFWLLVPLLILYLIKPRPVDQTIPSLMFLLQDKGKAFRNSFFRYLYRDAVLFMQILILVLLIAGAARPYISVGKDALVGNAVIVLDASASMQTDDGRWDEAVRIAEQALTGQNTIILIKNRPVIIARDANKADAQDALRGLEPSDTETNLYSGIVATREFLNGPDTIVTVISDFRNSDEQQDYRAAVSTVIASGAVVNLRGVGTQVDNIGIVSMDVTDARTRIGVRNFGTESLVATVRIEDFEQALPLSPGATDYVTITTPPGVTKVTLAPKDAFMLDNEATIANADDFAVHILVVTNDDDITKRPWWYALQSINEQTPLQLDIETVSPPQIPTIKHDIVVFNKVTPNLLVQRTIRDSVELASSGGGVIIMSQPDLFAIDYEELTPLSSTGKAGASSVDAGQFSALTQDIEFGDVQEYHVVNGEGGLVLATAGQDATPIIALYPVGSGQTLYYGIDDARASFPLEPTYPVFWKRVIDRLTGRISVERLNVGTGSTASALETPKRTPDKSDFTGFYDEQGTYEYDDRTIAVNLLSSAESDVSAALPDETLLAAAGAQASATKEKELTGLFALAALIMLFIELFVVKWRGDF